jgi:hypothetical protein
MLERDEWQRFVKRYPNQKARKAADAAVEAAELEYPDITLEHACSVWNDAYVTAVSGKS